MKSILPKAVRDLTQELVSLPGVGPKTAKRLSIHLLQQPRVAVNRFADALKNLHANVRVCRDCFNLSDQDVCTVCRDDVRRRNIICVVESPLDVEAIERTDSYDGLYHVLGGVLSPLEGVMIDQLTMTELSDRVKAEKIDEVIIALDPTVEGEATARYITQILVDEKVKMTKLGRGLPTGGDIEFADANTLAAAFDGRRLL